MAINWDPHYKRLLALEAQGYSQSEIADTLTSELGETVTRDAVRHALDRAHEVIPQLTEMPKPDRIPYVTKYADYLYDGRIAEPRNWDAYYAAQNKAKCKVLVQSDLHIPFHDEVMVTESINRNIDADVYAGVADLMDCYSQSIFMKNTDMPFIFEIDETLRVMEYLSNTFEVVILLEANHEDRVKKRLQYALPAELQFLAEKHILQALAAPFPNIFVETDLWFYQFGSVIFTHPERASKVELRAAMSVYEHFQEWEEAYDLRDWNVIIVAHTHQMNTGYASKAKIMEIGCLSLPMDYAFNAKIPYKRPHQNGYAVLTLNNGVADWNECREYKFPSNCELKRKVKRG